MKTANLWFNDLNKKENLLWWQEQGLSYTKTGYGSKIPTAYMVQLPGEKRWRRVYCCIYGNIGTLYVVVNGQKTIIHS